MKKLLEILTNARPDIDFETETQLVDDHILGSLDIIMIIIDINAAFDITIDTADFKGENFNSVAAMYNLIKECKNR